MICVLVLAMMIALSSATASGESTGICEGFRAEWNRVRQGLAQRVDEFAQAKEEPVTPRIKTDLAQQDARASMAKVVQSALQERSRRLADLRKKVEDYLRQERSAFDRWRLCAGDRSRRAGNSVRGHPEVEERERIMARLGDLLLDEAYLQYRDYRRPASADGSGYDSAYPPQARNRYWSGQDRPAPYADRSRYGPEGPGTRWNRFQGYFR